jgi:hypothetical protein
MKKIKNKICELFCKLFGIVPCVCKHDCGCKKKNEKKSGS